MFYHHELVKIQNESAKQLSYSKGPAKRAYASYITLLSERRIFALMVHNASGTGGEGE